MKDPFERIADQEDGRDDGLTWYFGETKQQMAERLGREYLAARQANIPLATIHDCFGTLAPHVGQLNEILLEQLRKLHSHNLLNELLESAKHDLPKSAHDELPELPKFGDLDMEGVLKSIRAFK
jgi:DNA-directed RNA polymerase